MLHLAELRVKAIEHARKHPIFEDVEVSSTFLPCHLSEDVSQQGETLKSLINDAPT